MSASELHNSHTGTAQQLEPVLAVDTQARVTSMCCNKQYGAADVPPAIGHSAAPQHQGASNQGKAVKPKVINKKDKVMKRGPRKLSTIKSRKKGVA